MKHSAFNSMQAADVTSQAEHIRNRLSSALRLMDELVQTPQPVRSDVVISEEQVRAALRTRRRRNCYFDSTLFADPAWDILLELYAAELGQRTVSVTSLCIGAAVPATTALRWIKTLERRGMIRRTADLMDGRRAFVSLTPATGAAMAQFFSNVEIGAVLS